MRASNPFDRTTRLIVVCLVCGGLVALLAAYLAWVGATGRGIACFIHTWTGFSCGSCGLTRALIAVGRLDFAAAFEYNLLWPVYMAWAAWVVAANGRTYVICRHLVGLPRPLWVHIAFVAAVTMYGVMRNTI